MPAVVNEATTIIKTVWVEQKKVKKDRKEQQQAVFVAEVRIKGRSLHQEISGKSVKTAVAPMAKSSFCLSLEFTV